jgi:very-short-patch-repair endonuclease
MRAPPRTIATARRLRRDATDAERKLWRALSEPPFKPWHFRRQVPLAGHIVDFASHRARLVVEVDGGQHGMAQGRRNDLARDASLKRHGYYVARFWNNDVMENLAGVLTAIQARLPSSAPPRRRREVGKEEQHR